MSKPNKDGWIRHRGGKCPVAAGQSVTIRCRDGLILDFGRACNICWSHKSSTGDVMAYRINKPAEQGIYAYEKDESSEPVQVTYVDSDGPIQWRDRINEIDRTIEALEEERVSLVQRLEDEGFRLIERVVEHEAQQPDPVRWMIGDSVECISSNYSFITVGTVYVITGFDSNMVQFLDDDETEMEYGMENFKFHTRSYK